MLTESGRRVIVEVRRAERRYHLNEDYFQEIDTPAKARWLGFLAADGCIVEVARNRVAQVLSVGLAQRDAEHLRQLSAALNYTGPLRQRTCRLSTGRQYTACRLDIHSTRLCEDLIGHGIRPRKSQNLQPWQGPHHLQRFWWAGMFDGDGHLGRHRVKGHWRYSLVGTLPVAQAFLAYLRPATRCQGSLVAVRNSFCASGGGRRSAREVARLFYSDLQGSIPLARKEDLARVLLAEPDRKHDWSSLSNDELVKLWQQHGTWAAVAETLGVKPALIKDLACRRGIRVATHAPWKHQGG
jgi:hypothetical protein